MKKIKIVKVLKSDRLLEECPQVIGATGEVVQTHQRMLLVKFTKNYYPLYNDEGKIVRRAPRPGISHVLFSDDEVEVIKEVDKTVELVTRSDIREMFGVSDQAITKWMNAERCPFPKPVNRGYPRKWSRKEIEKWEKKKGWFN